MPVEDSWSLASYPYEIVVVDHYYVKTTQLEYRFYFDQYSNTLLSFEFYVFQQYL